MTFFPLDLFRHIFLFLLACSLLCFCLVVFLCFCAFVLLVLLVLLVRANFFLKKKRFKTALITSFTLLLNLSYYKDEFFNHYNLFQLSRPFQLSQSFSIITTFFNYHNLFQSSLSESFLSQSFSISLQLVTLSLGK